jgi:integration host factor subunit alpha
MALTKNDIVTRVQDIGLTKRAATDAVESILEIMKQTLEDGEDVLISGFGKFCVKEKVERRGRNPATGDDMMLRPRKVVTFKCSGQLREKMNGR